MDNYLRKDISRYAQPQKDHVTTADERDAKHCRSTGRQQVQRNVVEQTNTETEEISQLQDTKAEPDFQVNFDDFRILAIDKENQFNNLRDRVEDGIRTVLSQGGQEMKNKLKTRNRFVRIEPVDFIKKRPYQGIGSIRNKKRKQTIKSLSNE